MKKALILLLLLVVACGGSSEETVAEDTTTTTVEDTTTTTIPPAPTSDINYIQLYNTKLGTELCNDAKEVDTTSEECLRQYKENLNYLITLQNEIGGFATDLIDYYETYPELVNQEYEDYINFIENEYSQVFTTLSTVENKYIERFGGEPELLNFLPKGKTLAFCNSEFNIEVSENLKYGEFNFKNDTGEKFLFKLSQFGDIEKVVNLQSGVFTLDTLYFENFLGEVFELKNNNLDFSFTVTNISPVLENITLIKLDENTGVIKVEYDSGLSGVDTVLIRMERDSISNGEIFYEAVNIRQKIKYNMAYENFAYFTFPLTSKGVAGDVDGEDGAGNIVTRNGLSVDNKPIKFKELILGSSGNIISFYSVNKGEIALRTYKSCDQELNNYEEIFINYGDKVLQTDQIGLQQLISFEITVSK
jgi:hypothetical protein